MKHFGNLIISLFLSIGVGTLAEATAKAAGPDPEPQSATLATNVSTSGSSAVSSQLHALEQQEKTDLQSLTQQMTDLKERHQAETTPVQQQLASFNGEFESAMKQLRTQYEDTRNQDDEARAALMDRIKPGYLALYNEKKASLANVNSQEEQSIQSLRQQEDAELQSIREKYDSQRKNLQQESAAQRKAIDSQFDSAVKGLK
jgi:hypothetical protein